MSDVWFNGPFGWEFTHETIGKDFWGHGWFEPFCILNLYLATSLIALFEIFVLNSIKRQVPVPAHVIATVFFLSAYLGWAAFGKWFTGLYPFFWMDPEIMKKTEYIASYVAGFLCLGPAGEQPFAAISWFELC